MSTPCCPPNNNEFVYTVEKKYCGHVDPCSAKPVKCNKVTYNGPNLECTDIDNEDNLCVVIQKIDDEICQLKEQINELQIALGICCGSITTTTSTSSTSTSTTTSTSTSTSTSTTTSTTTALPCLCYGGSSFTGVSYISYTDCVGIPQTFTLQPFGTFSICARQGSIVVTGPGAPDVTFAALGPCSVCTTTTSTTTTSIPSSTTTTTTTSTSTSTSTSTTTSSSSTTTSTTTTDIPSSTTSTSSTTTTTTTTQIPSSTTTSTTSTSTTSTTSSTSTTTTSSTSTTSTTTTAAPQLCYEYIATAGQTDLDNSDNNTVYFEYIDCNGNPQTISRGSTVPSDPICVLTPGTIYILVDSVQTAAPNSTWASTLTPCGEATTTSTTTSTSTSTSTTTSTTTTEAPTTTTTTTTQTLYSFCLGYDVSDPALACEDYLNCT